MNAFTSVVDHFGPIHFDP